MTLEFFPLDDLESAERSALVRAEVAQADAPAHVINEGANEFWCEGVAQRGPAQRRQAWRSIAPRRLAVHLFLFRLCTGAP